MEIVTSWMEKGLEKGREEGLEEGLRTLALRQLRRRLGNLGGETEAYIEALSTERLEELGEALLDFQNPGDLAAWLEAHGE